MARVVTIIGNICYGSGKFLHIGEKYDLEDPSLDKQIKSILIGQLAAGRTVCEGEPGTPFRTAGASRASAGGVKAKTHTAAIETPVQETPVDVAPKETDSSAINSDEVSMDSAVKELISAASSRRKIGK